ncbi:Flp family type IVb pilin [Nocardioides alcanivorans]|uniref:Flp family type IVb pilin n=1 Tax=Nocardioides alcanivorans TaxID=2897352 RepID=UPI001F3A4466|nr:Flp family type IVb pilin [Nocardioides alcanivorans]
MNDKLIQLYASTMAFFTTKRDDEKGATAVEYGLLVALIAVAIIIAVTTLGGQLSTLFENVSERLPGGEAPA